MAQNVSISVQQHKAIRALLTNSNQSDAAKAAGVTRRTVSRWLTQDDFKQALREAEKDALGEVTRVMAGHALQAVGVLLRIMVDPGQPASARVRAATGYLTLLTRLREAFELEERVAKLEGLL